MQGPQGITGLSALDSGQRVSSDPHADVTSHHVEESANHLGHRAGHSVGRIDRHDSSAEAIIAPSE
jgi:hypothetical protein